MQELLTQFGITVPDDKKKEFEAEFAKRYRPAADYDTQKAAADSWKGKYETEAAAFSAHKTDAALITALGAYKPRNAGTLKALLDMGKLKLKDDGSFEGLEDQIKALKKSNGYMFEPEKSGAFGFTGPGVTTRGVGTDPNADANAALHALFGS